MEEHRYVLPSNVYPSQKTLLETARPRLPLTDSTGNAQYRTVAAANIYNDQKDIQPRLPPNFLLPPTLPSQPARQHPQRTALEARRSQIRSRRSNRGLAPNPIIESEHYQAYRSRQIKGDEGDQIWPEDLEDLFLEALCLLPHMGRRKFSLNGKPHGRNELIALYLWIGHCESLEPGQLPDPSRQRGRKQVSSHIQVLKGFMRGHPAFDRLFPPKDAPRNGFEESFKNDPCLRALAQGRLPHRRAHMYDFTSSINPQLPCQPGRSSRQLSLSPPLLDQNLSHPDQALRPSIFQMYMTTLRPGVEFEDVPQDDTGDGKLSTKVHTYSDSIPHAKDYTILEALPNWRTRFPILAQLHAQNDLKCDIIHIEASLELRYGTLPERSELWSKFELLVPGKYCRQYAWRSKQTLFKPADLYGNPSTDPRYENVMGTPLFDRHEPGVGTHIRVSFPATPWAYVLQRLSTMEAQFDEAVQTGGPIPTPTTARQYIDQITMFQEIFCSVAPNQPFVRRAIVLWTFKKCKAGEQGRATWRHLDPSPSRSDCFSPHPGNMHVVSAAMSENFAAWADGMPQALPIVPEAPNPFDSLSQYDDLTTPIHNIVGSGGNPLQFSFPTYGYPPENMSYISHDTQDSDATLVDVQNGGGGSHMDNYMSSTGGLGTYDHNQNLWEAPPMQAFDDDASYLTNYGTVPPSATPQVWDAGEAKTEDWGGTDTGLSSFDAHLGPPGK